jgi:hypothetical protein
MVEKQFKRTTSVTILTLRHLRNIIALRGYILELESHINGSDIRQGHD